MRKIYYLFLTMLLGMVGLAANAQDITITVNVDDASRVKVYSQSFDNASYQYVNTYYEAEGNVFNVNISQYTSIYIECNNGYLFDEINDNGTVQSRYQYTSKYSTYGGADYTVNVKTVVASDVRTGVCLLEIDDPSAVKMQMQNTYADVTLDENNKVDGKYVINFIPSVETGIQLGASVYGTNLYSVVYNDVPVSGSYGNYYITFDTNADSHNLVVQAKAPEGQTQNVKISYNDEADGFITSVTVNGVEIPKEEYSAEEGFTVDWGAKIAIYGDVNNYKVNSFFTNSSSVYFSGSTTFDALEDYVVTIDAAPYQKLKAQITIDNIENVSVTQYDSNTWSNVPIEGLKSGLNEIEISEGNPSITIKPANELVSILSVTADNVAIEDPYGYGYSITITDGMVINIETKALVRDKKLVVYINDVAETYYGYANLESGTSSNKRTVYLENGYNVIDFYEGEQFSLGVNAASNVSFKNGETFSGYYITPEDGDVLKYFVSSESDTEAPTANDVTFTLDNKLTAADVTVTYDRVKTLSNLTAGLSAFAGTEVSIVANNDKVIAVKVNDADVTAVEGVFTFTVDAATTVDISDVTSTGINAINAANADNSFYTLQGVKVNGKAKGLYIKNGKKVVVNK